MKIQGGRIHKANKKPLNAKGKGKGKCKGKDKSYIPKPKNPKPYAKEHLKKDDACQHYKEVGHYKRNCPAYIAELIKKMKQVGTASSSSVFTIELFSFLNKSWVYDTGYGNGIRTQVEAIGSDDLVLPNSLNYALETATRIHNMVPTKKVDKTPHELWYGKVPNLSYLNIWGCEALVKRDTPDKLQQRFVKCIFIGYPKETVGYYFYFPPENKIVFARYGEFLKKNLISQEVSGRAEELEDIQDIDTSPSENTSKISIEVEGFNHLKRKFFSFVGRCYAEMQSIKDNQVWCLVDLHPNCKIVGSK
nr:retrotransposon protein, putative, Ty1-copia subclass [Tanacetum cinerariifolium]